MAEQSTHTNPFYRYGFRGWFLKCYYRQWFLKLFILYQRSCTCRNKIYWLTVKSSEPCGSTELMYCSYNLCEMPGTIGLYRLLWYEVVQPRLSTMYCSSHWAYSNRLVKNVRFSLNCYVSCLNFVLTRKVELSFFFPHLS